jgi:hypothetical protein
VLSYTERQKQGTLGGHQFLVGNPGPDRLRFFQLWQLCWAATATAQTATAEAAVIGGPDVY